MRAQRILIMSAVCAAAIAFAASGVDAQQRMKGGPRDGRGAPPACAPEHCPPMMFGDPARHGKALGLNDTQITQIGDINRKFQKQMLDFRERLTPKRIQLKRMLLEDSVDINQVRGKLREISDITLEIRVLKIQQRLEIEKVLTPAQKARLREMRMGPHHRRFDRSPDDM